MAVVEWSGDIPDGTVWSSQDVHHLTAATRVPDGSTLTIEPGATVKSRAHAGVGLIIDGTLTADGTEAAPIVFTSDLDDSSGGDTRGDGPTTGSDGDWDGIRFAPTSSSSVLDFAEVRFGGDLSFSSQAFPVFVDGGNLTLTNSTIRNSQHPALRIANSNPTIANVTFQDNVGPAASLDLASNPDVTNVTMTNNGVNAFTLDSGVLSGEQAWDDPDVVYRLSGDITVAAGATVTVGPGQIVKARAHAGDAIRVEGTFIADGTSSAPIVFTSDRDDFAGGDTNNNTDTNVADDGDWDGIRFDPTSTGNVMDHVEVRYGGDFSFSGQAFSVFVNGAELSLTNSTLRNSQHPALRIANSNPTVDNVTFQDNFGSAASLDLASNPNVTNVTMSNNGVNAFTLDAGVLSGDQAWDDPDVVYRLSGDVTVEAGATLTIGPGQTVKARAHAGDAVLVEGTFIADGTPTAPIVITSDRDDSAGGDTNNNADANLAENGNWDGIRFDPTSTGNVLDHVEVRYGGDFSFSSQAFSVFVNGAELSLTNSTIRNSQHPALRIANSNPTVDNVTFQDNVGPAASLDLASNPDVTNVTMSNNSVNAFTLDAGVLSGEQAWDDPDVVYRLSGDVTVEAGATLTIGPGQTVKARAHSGDAVLVAGTFIADGTPAAPIVFTSDRDDTAGGDTNNNADATLADDGNWDGLRFEPTSSGNVLDHVEVRYGGDFSFSGQAYSVFVNGAELSLTNSTIRNSQHPALRIANSNPTVDNVTFHDNVGPAASLDLASNPDVTNVTMSNNGVNAFTLDAGILNSDQAWDDPDVVYRLSGDVTVAAGATLTVGPGQTVKARAHSGDAVLVAGTFIADGTPAAPIVFTSDRDDSVGGDTNNNIDTDVAGRGNWDGIRFEPTSTGNVMDYVEVRYGGDFSFSSQAFSVFVNGAQLTLTNSTIRDSEHPALRISSADPTVENVGFQDNFGAAVSMDLDSSPDFRQVTMSNNGVNAVLLDAGFFYCHAVWDDPGVVYQLSGDVTVSAGAILDVVPGQVIKAGDGHEIIVHGRLNARGTAAAPIIFTADRDDSAGGDTDNDGVSNGVRGDWGGLVVTSLGRNNVLDHAEVRFSGDNNLAAVTADGATLTVSNSRIVSSSSRGVFARNGAAADLTNNIIAENAANGVHAESGAAVTIVNSTVHGNHRGVAAIDAAATLVNSLITGQSRSGLFVSGTGNVDASFSIVFNPIATAGDYEGLVDQTGTNSNLSADPLYVAAAEQNFELADGSPAIDSAMSVGAPPNDLLNRTRVDDPGVVDSGSGPITYVDRGALEHQAEGLGEGGESEHTGQIAHPLAAPSLFDSVAASRSNWINRFNLLDVNDDGHTASSDVLRIINDLNRDGARELPSSRPAGGAFLDVNGDFFATPADVLVVINELNRGTTSSIMFLAESTSLLSETSRLISVGHDSGARNLRLEVKTRFDTSDGQPAVPDLLLIYLVDSNDPSRTLLDRGESGTPFFSWSARGLEITPGVARFDGRFLDVDLTSVVGSTDARLVVQSLNTDSDAAGRSFVRIVSNEVSPAAAPLPQLIVRQPTVPPGSALDTHTLSPDAGLSVIVDNVHFDSSRGKFLADVRVRNNGSTTGRQVAVALPGLTGDVALANRSGLLQDGTPYLSVREAIPFGGLRAGSTSERIRLEIDSPALSRFPLAPTALTGSTNQAPVLEEIAPLSVMPGRRLEQQVSASDPDGDPVVFSIPQGSALPNARLTADGRLIVTPKPGQEGVYTFVIQATDGALRSEREVTLEVPHDQVGTTRISGVIENTSLQPLAGIPISIADTVTTTDETGAFLIEFSAALPSDTLKVHGEDFAGATVYPFIAEKLPLVLGHEVYAGVENVIDRPIYLPPIDVSNEAMIDPSQDTIVATTAIPGAELTVAAGTLSDQDGSPYSGPLGITEVPVDLTPAALPADLVPSTVVTIQPGDMVFQQPAPLSLPNTDGWAPGTELNLWSINPITGFFDAVGLGRVGDDGAVIDTVSGGIRNSSWHFFTNEPSPPIDPAANPLNEQPICDECVATASITSQVELHSGAVIETHSLASYQSLETARGVTLQYDSLRADPRPIVHIGYADVDPRIYSVPSALRLTAKLTLRRGDFQYELPGYAGDIRGLTGGEHFWSVPAGRGSVDASLQLDLRSEPSGRYFYDVLTGLRGYAGSRGYIGASHEQTGSLLLINATDSPFGAGWGMAGLQQLVENPDGSILLIDGDGSELLFEAPAAAGESYVSPPGDFSILERLGNGTYRRTLKDQTVYTFDAAHRLATVHDRNANTTHFEYDAAGVIAKIVDPVGLETVFTKVGDRVSSVADPGGRVTRFEYDAAGNMTRVTDPDGTSRTFGYDGLHHMVSEVDKRGSHEEAAYDFAGRLTRATRKDGSVIHVSPAQTRGLYPASQTSEPFSAPAAVRFAAAESQHSSGRGYVTQTELDAQGQVVSQLDSLGTLPSVVRTAENLVSSTRDARGHTTGFTYDERGNLVATVDEVSSAGVLALYTFEGEARDVTDMGHDGIVSGALLAEGFEGQGFRFDGVNDFIELPLNINPSLHPRLTMGAWVRASNGDPIRQVISHADGCYDRSIGIDFRGGGAGWSAFTGSGEVLRGDSVDLDQWTFVAAVYDQDASSVTFYVNEQSFTEQGSLEDGFESVRLGSNPAFGEFFAGTMDNVFFIADALSATQVQAIRTGGAGGVLASASGGTATEYDETYNLPTRHVDELGRETLFQIDESTGDVTSVRQVAGGADDAVTGFTYDTRGLVATITDPNGNITQFERDGFGRATAVTSAAGSPAESTVRYEYDAFGNTTTLIDGNGARTAFEYDVQNRIIRITEADPDGETGPLDSPVTQMSYDESGNLAAVTDERGSTTTFTHDLLDRLIQTTDALGNVERWSYDADGNVTSMVDRLGRETNYRYDGRGRLIETIDALGNRARVGYDDDGNIVAVTDENGNTTTMSYDARGRLSRTVNPLGGAVLFQYDLTDQLVSVTNENGSVTQFGYDDLGRQIVQQDALGGLQHYSYDANGNLTSVVDELSRATQLIYDERDRIVSQVNPLGAAVSYRYDAVGNLSEITNELGDSTQYSYDALNRMRQRTNALRGVMSFTYDARDNLLAATDELGRSIAHGYDELNRRTSTTDPLGNVHAVSYDAVGNLVQSTDPLGHATTFLYDDLDRQVRRTDAAGGTTTSSYDAAGNLLSSTDALNNKLQFRYDARNRVIRETDALGASRQYLYDAVGNLTSIVDRNDRVREFSYDELDRRIEERWLDLAGNPLHTVEYSLDAASQLLAAADPVSSYSYAYDADGRLASMSNSATLGAPEVTFTYGYDAADNLLSREETVDGVRRGLNTHVYDQLSRLTQITQSGAGVLEKRVDLAYDAASQFASITRFADLAGTQLVASSTYTFDDGGRLHNLVHANATAELASYAWAYDSASRIVSATSVDGTTTYSYDDTGQLVAADHSVQNDESFSYDLNGNRTNAGYETGAGNRLLSDGDHTYEYDGEGNRTHRTRISDGEVTEYSWDYRNRLVEVTVRSDSGTIIRRVEYTYDVFDRRIARSVDGDGAGPQEAEIERLVYDGANIALAFDVAGAETHRYLHGPAPDQVFSDSRALEEVLWPLTDNLGTVRDVVDSTGAIQNHLTYDSFGAVVNESSSATEFRFGHASRDLDRETGNYYLRSRFYDPAAGRFLSEDPLGLQAGDANVYRYAGNQVTTHTDPSGLAFSLAVSGGAGVVSAGGYILASFVTDGEITAGGVSGAFAGGFAAGAVASALAGDPSALAATHIVGIGAVAGGTGAVTGSVVQQSIDTGTVDTSRVVRSGIAGVAGGTVGALVFVFPAGTDPGLIRYVVSGALGGLTSGTIEGGARGGARGLIQGGFTGGLARFAPRVGGCPAADDGQTLVVPLQRNDSTVMAAASRLGSSRNSVSGNLGDVAGHGRITLVAHGSPSRVGNLSAADLSGVLHGDGFTPLIRPSVFAPPRVRTVSLESCRAGLPGQCGTSFGQALANNLRVPVSAALGPVHGRQGTVGIGSGSRVPHSAGFRVFSPNDPVQVFIWIPPTNPNREE